MNEIPLHPALTNIGLNRAFHPKYLAKPYSFSAFILLGCCLMKVLKTERMYSCDFSHILSMVGGKVCPQMHRFMLVETRPKTQDCRPLEVKFVQRHYYRRDRCALSPLAMWVATVRIAHSALPASF